MPPKSHAILSASSSHRWLNCNPSARLEQEFEDQDTGDCLIIASPRLHVIDFKYGLGVLVDAYQNPQMMLYALGALRIFDLIAELTGVGGYLDIGINDTMKDRLVNFLDAVIFSIVLLRQAARTGQIRRKDHTEGIDAG